MRTNFASRSKRTLLTFRGFKPISRSFFALPSSNASEQFIYFVSLVSWLLSVNNHQVTGWNKYDDPMTASQNVSKLKLFNPSVLELKKLGIELDMPPNKLKAGCGEGVCIVLQKLCTMSLKIKFTFKKPVIRQEGAVMEEEADDMGEDMDGNADIADMANQEISDEEDIADFQDFGGQGNNNEDQLQNQII